MSENESLPIPQATDLRKLESHVVMDLANATPEQLHLAYAAINYSKRMARDIEKLLDDRVKEYILRNGAFEVEGVRYYIGTEKKTKCIFAGEYLNIEISQATPEDLRSSA